jgi:iron(III) transport system permease protein
MPMNPTPPRTDAAPRGRRLALRRLPWFVLIPAGLAGLATVIPLAYLLVRAFEADPATILRLVWRERTLTLLQNTIALTVGVMALTSLLAIPLAWLVVRSDLRWKRLWTTLAVVPLAIPGYVVAYALISLGGNQGFLTQLIDTPIPRPSGYWGALVALSLYTYPYLFLNVRAALLGLDPSLEESARSLGYRDREILTAVILPQLRPALLSGYLVIALYVLGDFGVVALMRFEAFSYAIYVQYASAFDRTYAAWLSLILLAMTLGIVISEARLLGGRRFARTGSGSQRAVLITRLRRLAPLAYLYSALVVLAAVGLPLLVLGSWLMLAPPSASAWWGVMRSFGLTAGIAAPAALLTAAAAMAVAYLATRVNVPGSRVIERLAYLGYAIPPVSLALALVFFSLRSLPWLYQSVWLLIGAYVISFMALAVGPIRSALLQLPARLEEAARSLGRRPIAAFFQSTFPAIRPSVLAGTALVLMVAMKELPLTYLLGPTGYHTLAVRVFSRTSEGMLAEAAPFALAIVLFSSLFVGLLIRYEGRDA